MSFRSLLTRASIAMDRKGLVWLSRKVPRQGWKKNHADEIEIEIPVGEGIKKDDIHMLVDEKNNLVLTQGNLKHQEIPLPLDANFEKALITSRLKDGVVTVNFKNFMKNEVEIKLTKFLEDDDEGGNQA
ncbi:hypothetical protein HanIR_Chr08g0364501 [Helianthus annuus]|nr:hypothetical protein HanIR_Chr08g0364501 [Helianthus annuus]